MLTSVEVGLGGTWLMCPPQVLFIPDRNGDDRPDSAPEVVLDGFTVPTENYHNFANGLRWGPDGWLYGRCGASSPGLIGTPGTPDAERIPVTGGMWRYDPRSKRVEVLNHGTTNPWGHDWDALGELFFINTVNGHLWHSIPGAHFVRPHTIDLNPTAYAAIDQHADHFHWDTAKDWSDSRVVTAEHDRAGGGHAHSGMMIYNGDQWPASDRGKLFTLNFHGRRTNVERLERQGDGFVGKHEPDRFFMGDTRFRGIDLSAGPDGSGVRPRLERLGRVPREHRRAPELGADLSGHLWPARAAPGGRPDSGRPASPGRAPLGRQRVVSADGPPSTGRPGQPRGVGRAGHRPLAGDAGQRCRAPAQAASALDPVHPGSGR